MKYKRMLIACQARGWAARDRRNGGMILTLLLVQHVVVAVRVAGPRDRRLPVLAGMLRQACYDQRRCKRSQQAAEPSDRPRTHRGER